ncbi:MAG: hypothetical protein MZU97_20135 [Bacillus subtilis]|nr:hypothetical protein [Bacillus subtilis]
MAAGLRRPGRISPAAPNDLVVGQWYMFTFTVKSSVNRQMMLRMGLQTDQANGWLDDFDGNAAGNFMNLTTEYVTYRYFFKLNSLVSSNGSSEFKIELNLGNINYSGVGAGSVTSFKDVYMYQLTETFLPPSFTEVDSAQTPHKLTAGTALPTFEGYVRRQRHVGSSLGCRNRRFRRQYGRAWHIQRQIHRDRRTQSIHRILASHRSRRRELGRRRSDRSSPSWKACRPRSINSPTSPSISRCS